MLRSVQICKKCTIFGNLKTTTQEGKKETRQMTPFSPSTFWALTICDIHFCTWKMSKFVFMGSPLWSILVCKIPEFWRWKLWNQNLVPFDSGNIHIKESKEPGLHFQSSWEPNLSDLMVYMWLKNYMKHLVQNASTFSDHYVFMKLLLNCTTRTVAIFKDVSRTCVIIYDGELCNNGLRSFFGKTVNAQKLLHILT